VAKLSAGEGTTTTRPREEEEDKEEEEEEKKRSHKTMNILCYLQNTNSAQNQFRPLDEFENEAKRYIIVK